MDVGIIIILFVLGILAILCEIFIPGGILGVTGVMLLLGSVIYAFSNLGPNGGIIVLVLGVILAPIIWFIGLSFFPRSPLAKYLTLKTSIEGKEKLESPTGGNLADELKGAEGVATSMLRPAGIADINGKRFQVITQGEILNQDTKIKVIRVEGNQIIVRKA